MRPARKREMVDRVRAAWRVSIRRACQALPVDRSTYHYRSKRTGQAPLMKRIKEIAETRVRYGYRRIHVLLRREGWPVNHKRVRRLYGEMGLQLRNKSPKRRVKAKLRDDRTPATAANQVWAMDFVHDQLFDGTKLRILTVVDTFTRLSPAIDARRSYRSIDVVATLDRAIRTVGCPKIIRLDNGPEFVGRELDLWTFVHGVDAGLLTTREANRQRLHRESERQVSRGMPERQLVHEPRRGSAKMRGLASRLQ